MIDRHILLLRFVLFVVVFVLAWLLERVVPARENRRRGSVKNLALAASATITSRLLVPLSLVLWASAWHGGLFPLLGLGLLPASLLGIVGLDLTIYLQHRLFHAVGWLWRLHRVHHADVELDVTSGIRFHPGEFVVSTLIKLGAITLLGVPAVGVLGFEVLLNTSSLFTHANVRIPPRLERIIRWVFVTPAMHLIHHSCDRHDLDRNYGFLLSLWDHLFATYRPRSAAGDGAPLRLGLPGREDDPTFLGLLLMPFHGDGRPPRRGAPEGG